MEDFMKDFDVPRKHPSDEALRNWRMAMTIVKNRRRRFRHVANLDKRGAKVFELEDILSATNNFSDEKLLKKSALGKMYKGKLYYQGTLQSFKIRRLDCTCGQGGGFQTEINMIRRKWNKNVIFIHGFCDENNEQIIIYNDEQTFYGTLDQHLRNPTLKWFQRLGICLGVAKGLNHIHYDVIHCDISSSKIFLDKDWEPKIYGFELSTEYPQTWRHRLLFSSYFDTNTLTPKYDVYSFGVLLLEVLCGRKPMITNYGVEEELDEIIDPKLRKQMGAQTLALFTNIAYNCLNQNHARRPTMDQIVKELEEVLDLQWQHENLGPSKAMDGDLLSNRSELDSLAIPLGEIRRATNGFSEACLIGSGAYANVYVAELDVLDIQNLSQMKGKHKDERPKIRKTVAIKRIKDEQGKEGVFTEIELLSCCRHQNIISLLGFSREAHILIYEFASNGSLNDYLVKMRDGKRASLTWVQRIQICLDIAHGISYLHTDMEGELRIIHRDIKSDNILLDENMKAKLSDFGLSKSIPMIQQPSSVNTKHIVGTMFYLDPEYSTTAKYKKGTDIYSFGVVLFEVLSGRVAYDTIYTTENPGGLAPIARRRFNEKTLKELIDPKMLEEVEHIFTLNRGPNQDSFRTFSEIAYQCLAETQVKRPTIEVVIKELQNALDLQGETVVLSRLRLSDIVLATENFAETYCIGLDTIGMVYKAELYQLGNNGLVATEGKSAEPSKKHITVAIKRITSREGGQGKQEFFEEIEMRTSYKHPNIVSLLGLCDESNEMILVYEHVSERSLEDYLKSIDDMDTFTWTQRLQACLEIARGLNHLHSKMVNPQRIMHIDMRSANILLEKNCGAKLAYFVISKLHPAANQEIGMKVYEDPEYETTHKLERKYDIYSFGVMLFEIFCGRVAYDPVYIVENNKGLAPIARQRFNDGTIQSIMDPRLKEKTDEDTSTSNRRPNKFSLDTFLKIADQCLGEAAKRPTMEMVIKELEMALKFHVSQYFSKYN
ncbi:putative protein kinase RLK-Pelle-CR4L family [Helianthus anomalus]